MTETLQSYRVASTPGYHELIFAGEDGAYIEITDAFGDEYAGTFYTSDGEAAFTVTGKTVCEVKEQLF